MELNNFRLFVGNAEICFSTEYANYHVWNEFIPNDSPEPAREAPNPQPLSGTAINVPSVQTRCGRRRGLLTETAP